VTDRLFCHHPNDCITSARPATRNQRERLSARYPRSIKLQRDRRKRAYPFRRLYRPLGYHPNARGSIVTENIGANEHFSGYAILSVTNHWRASAFKTITHRRVYTQIDGVIEPRGRGITTKTLKRNDSIAGPKRLAN